MDFMGPLYVLTYDSTEMGRWGPCHLGISSFYIFYFLWVLNIKHIVLKDKKLVISMFPENVNKLKAIWNMF